MVPIETLYEFSRAFDEIFHTEGPRQAVAALVRRHGRIHIPEKAAATPQPFVGSRRLLDRERLLQPRTSLPPRAAPESRAARGDGIRRAQPRRHARRLTRSRGKARRRAVLPSRCQR
jgi:hypothetical protein